jgi:thiol-disulfide isomerase/thioredoxin
MFNSEFKGKIKFDVYDKFIESISGKWRNHMKAGVYEIPFIALSSESPYPNYKNENIPDGAKYYPSQLDGKWEVTFSPGTKDEYKSIGVFKSEDLKITGTFMTETGDYRYLEGIGNMIDPIQLSCFDGSHAFYFDYAPNKNNDTLRGMFYSGKHWKEPWVAIRNDKFELRNPDSLTFLKDGYKEITFSFPNLSNEKVDFPSEKYKNKVTIIQIMGTWCPNCMDETKVLSDFYTEYNSKGLEVIGLAFETSADFEKASKDVSNHKKYFNAPYEFLIAGQSGTKYASAALPMLNKVMSFPTTIFIDKNGNVRKISTGFYGPGTGSYYTRYIEQTSDFIEKLLSE